MFLFRHERRGCIGIVSRNGWSGQEVHIDPPNPAATEFNVTGGRTCEWRRRVSSTVLGDQLLRHNLRSALGENSRLGNSDTRHVANGIDSGKSRLQSCGINRYPSV